jgi:hypothetical protein
MALRERREAWSASINEKDWCKDAEAYRSCQPRFEAIARDLAVFWLWRDCPCFRWQESGRVVL